jgi:hypothetical protein
MTRDVVRARDTFAYDPDMTEAEARGGWVEAAASASASSIVGTVPEAFAHPRHGRVGLHVMGRAP